MSSVVIKCPGTGRPVSTGTEIEPSVFRRLEHARTHVLSTMRQEACLDDGICLAQG
jgi:hypothetical protein